MQCFFKDKIQSTMTVSGGCILHLRNSAIYWKVIDERNLFAGSSFKNRSLHQDYTQRYKLTSQISSLNKIFLNRAIKSRKDFLMCGKNAITHLNHIDPRWVNILLSPLFELKC